jgi:hypothetical protein
VICLSKSKKDNSKVIAEEIFCHVDLDERWQKVIVDLAKKQVKEMETAEEWADIIRQWKWWDDPHPWLIETLNMLAKVPAASAYLLAIKYVFYKKLDDSKMRRKDFQVLAARFRRAFIYLYQAGLIRGEPITPEEIGPGRRSVTIWIAPFASDYDMAVAKEFYLRHTEGRSGKEIKNKKVVKEVSNYNRKIKVESMLDSYKINPHLNNWYMCPKKHPDAFTYRKKLKSRYKRRSVTPKCSQCDRDLIIISHEEFIERVKNKLYKEFGIKQ